MEAKINDRRQRDCQIASRINDYLVIVYIDRVDAKDL